MDIQTTKRRQTLYINNNFISGDFSIKYTTSEHDVDVQIETFEKTKILSCSNEDAIIKEFINGIREELLEHGYLYGAFLASIVSAVDESRQGTSNEKLAENILKRIIGEK